MMVASGVDVVEIWTQPDDDGQQHPVEYKLIAAGNYPVHNLELLAVVHMLLVLVTSAAWGLVEV